MITVRITSDLVPAPARPVKLRSLVRTVCKRFRVSRAEIGIAIVDDARMRGLNRRHLNRRGSTDCLSFDLSEEADRTKPRVFDIIVNGELAMREAARRGHSAEAELALYVVHGLLHQLGFDDAAAPQAERMHAMEDEILRDLGYGSVYNADARTHRTLKGN